jgi:hypothetical protein
MPSRTCMSPGRSGKIYEYYKLQRMKRAEDI